MSSYTKNVTKRTSSKIYNEEWNGNGFSNGYNNNKIYDDLDNTNKNNDKKKKNRNGFRENLQINEFTFSLLLFTFSLSIVIGKLFINYGETLQWQIEDNYIKKLSSMPAFSMVNVKNLSSAFKPGIILSGDRLMAVGENLINVSQKCEEVVYNTVVQISIKNWKWIRAVLSGFSMMAFTWYIIYKDSSVPGVNPPSPLSSLTKRRGHKRFSMQINYFVGVLNGILMFVYLIL